MQSEAPSAGTKMMNDTLKNLINILNRCKEKYATDYNHYGDIAVQIIELVDELGGAGEYHNKKVTVSIDYRHDLSNEEHIKVMQIVLKNKNPHIGIVGIKVIVLLHDKPFFAMVHHIYWYEKLFDVELKK